MESVIIVVNWMVVVQLEHIWRLNYFSFADVLENYFALAECHDVENFWNCVLQDDLVAVFVFHLFYFLGDVRYE